MNNQTRIKITILLATLLLLGCEQQPPKPNEPVKKDEQSFNAGGGTLDRMASSAAAGAAAGAAGAATHAATTHAIESIKKRRRASRIYSKSMRRSRK